MVDAQIAVAQLRINSEIVDGRRALYPLLTYREITYVPLTWNLCRALGLQTGFTMTGPHLSVKANPSIPIIALIQDTLPSTSADRVPGTRIQASIVNYMVTIGEETIDNATQVWPLLNYADITYLPLTWYFIHDLLGLSYDYQGAPASTLYLGRSPQYNNLAESQVNQVLLSAMQLLRNSPLTIAEKTTLDGVLIKYGVTRFDASLDLIWQSSFDYQARSEDHLLQLQSPGVGSSVYSELQVFRSTDGYSWQEQIDQGTELPLRPALPFFELNHPPGGRPVFEDEGQWYFELQHLSQKLVMEEEDCIVLMTYRFSLDEWSLKSITYQEILLHEGQMVTEGFHPLIVCDLTYGKIEGIPRP